MTVKLNSEANPEMEDSRAVRLPGRIVRCLDTLGNEWQVSSENVLTVLITLAYNGRLKGRVMLDCMAAALRRDD
jgi:aspartokinase-like uncharacterized kinase